MSVKVCVIAHNVAIYYKHQSIVSTVILCFLGNQKCFNSICLMRTFNVQYVSILDKLIVYKRVSRVNCQL